MAFNEVMIGLTDQVRNMSARGAEMTAPAMNPVANAVLFELRDAWRRRSTRIGMAAPVAPSEQLGTCPDVAMRTSAAARWCGSLRLDE